MGVNELDYKMIGQRIRAERNKKGWQQAELAFRAGMTSAHLSHIETAQTKLALPTIVKIANALSVSVDELLYDSMEQVKVVYDKKIAEELEDCDPAELQAFLEIIQSTKKVLPRIIMLCAFVAMLMINLFAWNFSSISLMLIAAAISLSVFCIQGAPDQKGGAKK